MGYCYGKARVAIIAEIAGMILIFRQIGLWSKNGEKQESLKNS